VASFTPRKYGPANATCEVLVFREGLLSAVGHDLLLRVTSFEIAVEGEHAVSGRFDAGSLRVVIAMREGHPLPDALRPRDRREIEETIAGTVLHVDRFPDIRFASSEVRRTPTGYGVRGSLTLAGHTRPLELVVRRDEGRLGTDVTLRQPDFGIKPYRAMLGALRVKEDVIVRVSIPWEDEE
jgi:hypothetical protein